MSPAAHAALQAAMKLGLPAFPCLQNKHPACPHGFKDARLPESGLATLWARHPGELVGVPTGAASGFDVLDVDRRHGGGEWYTKVKTELPPMRIHRTRSGGLHVFFSHRPALRCSVGRIAPGVDVRADGGYTVWWPQQGLEVRDYALGELPAWPDWILARLDESAPEPPRSAASVRTPSNRLIVAQLAGLARAVAGAVEGQRNSTLFWAANRAAEMAREGRIQPGVARDLLHSLGARCGLPAIEVKRTVASAFRGSP